MRIDPASLPASKRYGLLISVIQPRPIAWVSTQDSGGRLNLAPFSFFTGITSAPMTVCFAPARDRHGGKKDTLLNIEETREFVINTAVDSLAEKMVKTSAEYPREVSEFEEVGLTPEPSALVRPPRVKESPVSLECGLDRIVTISEGPLGGSLIIGKVLQLHIDDALWKDGRISHKDLHAVGRLERDWYTRPTDTFRIPRPKLG